MGPEYNTWHNTKKQIFIRKFLQGLTQEDRLQGIVTMSAHKQMNWDALLKAMHKADQTMGPRGNRPVCQIQHIHQGPATRHQPACCSLLRELPTSCSRHSY